MQVSESSFTQLRNPEVVPNDLQPGLCNLMGRRLRDTRVYFTFDFLISRLLEVLACASRQRKHKGGIYGQTRENARQLIQRFILQG